MPGREPRRNAKGFFRCTMLASKPGVVAVHNSLKLTDDQVLWLKRILQSKPKGALPEPTAVPEEVQDALVEKGLVRRWRNGTVEITLDGIREAARSAVAQDGVGAAKDEDRRVALQA